MEGEPIAFFIPHPSFFILPSSRRHDLEALEIVLIRNQ